MLNFDQNDPISIINFLEKENIIDETATRKFFIFCASQIWDLLDEEEKNIVNLSEDYLNGKISLQKLNIETQRIFLNRKERIIGNDSVSKYLFGKLSIAMICGYCQNISPKVKFRRMARIAKGVQFVRMASNNNIIIKSEMDEITKNQANKLIELYSTYFQNQF